MNVPRVTFDLPPPDNALNNRIKAQAETAGSLGWLGVLLVPGFAIQANQEAWQRQPAKIKKRSGFGSNLQMTARSARVAMNPGVMRARRIIRTANALGPTMRKSLDSGW